MKIPRPEDTGLAELDHDGAGILWYSLNNAHPDMVPGPPV